MSRLFIFGLLFSGDSGDLENLSGWSREFRRIQKEVTTAWVGNREVSCYSSKDFFLHPTRGLSARQNVVRAVRYLILT
ncbi:hypothetical protein LFML04_1215 [Leptospirillum ferriphilum ML-04]|uniref:Uncharacterized protein n=1 Tax=Leptospirillum ferriphilum (strain ML-04) TaxID=1048260 RepID=J9ZBA8_LEPFM|nr:hypothetical protein LFML04_1215 [Leptospirillum ferriphilum ML-04]